MLQDKRNLYEGMRHFFRELPSHYTTLGEEEQIELVWMPRGKNQPTHRECFPDLEKASSRAVSLGPAHDVFLQAVVEPGTTPWNTESTQLLASWCARDRRPEDQFEGYDGNTVLSELRPLPYGEPSLVFLQFYPVGPYTYVASWYYYRSRCPEQARIERQRQTRLTEEDGPDKPHKRHG